MPGSFSDYLSLMLGKPRIRLNNLKTSLRFSCLGRNLIIDSINLGPISVTDARPTCVHSKREAKLSTLTELITKLADCRIIFILYPICLLRIFIWTDQKNQPN